MSKAVRLKCSTEVGYGYPLRNAYKKRPALRKSALPLLFLAYSFIPTLRACHITVRRLPTAEASPTVSDFFAPSRGADV